MSGALAITGRNLLTILPLWSPTPPCRNSPLVPTAGGPRSEKQVRICRVRIPATASCLAVGIPRVLCNSPSVRLESSVLRSGAVDAKLTTTADGGARAGSLRQCGRRHPTAVTHLLSVGVRRSNLAIHIKFNRFAAGMAAGGSSKNDGGFVPASDRKETTLLAEKNLNETGNALMLVTFEGKDGRSEVGIVRGQVLWAVQELLNARDGKSASQIGNMEALITSWNSFKDKLDLEESGKPLAEFKLLAPIPRPSGAVMCIGKNYLDHVREVDTWKSAPAITAPEAPKHPIVFTKAPQAVIGPGAAINYPHGVSSAVDYEAELAVIIGTAGRMIKREDAMSHIFGYTILNDVTARDLQKLHQQWFLGKSCDTFCPMGPGIVPASEIDANNLRIECWVNDQLRQDGCTSQMIFGIAELIEVISKAITLQPGDIIATGTPAGVGSGFDPPRHLSPGDKIRIRIEGIGELNNHVQ